MLSFERRVVAALTAHLEDGHRRRVVEHVDGALGAMPQHLRAGLAGESVLLGAWARLRAPGAWARLRGASGPVDLGSLDHHPVGLVRQYVRALRSLVLLAEHELAPVHS